ncbi:protein LURP-one-related 8-like [Iris pallida]|uniref:Protein LURP-one-related 8-like n=1 Tax=Iris pallida TaxID=29817 RepID=A0AAX6ELZ6_IRIPA|nr:protein LURP-one-related 8-like [Iris pallida]
MAKIHPNNPVSVATSSDDDGDRTAAAAAAAAMTVWRKSLLFNCKGFTVYDGTGNLLFRVDNYSSSSSSSGEIVLMDAYGKCLVTIKRKRLSIGEKWLIYSGEEAIKPEFSVKKNMSFHQSKVLARVTTSSSSSNPTDRCRHSYSIEGSYSHNQCTIYDDRRRPVGEVERKEAAAGIALGCDVFRLVVQPELDAPLAMAMVIALEQMYGS